jgi:transcriptional regulator with XRE-family HTH domain
MLNLTYIRSRREALDLSLADAARLAGWGVKARTRWHDIESGRAPNPTLKTLLDMARVLQCEIGQLVK